MLPSYVDLPKYGKDPHEEQNSRMINFAESTVVGPPSRPSSLLPRITGCLFSSAFLFLPFVFASADGNSPNHNLQQYLYNIDPTRDVALMNKVRRAGKSSTIENTNPRVDSEVPEEYWLLFGLSCAGWRVVHAFLSSSTSMFGRFEAK